MEARTVEQTAAQQGIREVSNAAGHQVINAAAPRDAARTSIAADSTTGDKGARAALQQRAYHLAATRLIPITLRLPEGLNDWLDDYAHEHRKEGIKKQDLISRAVQLLVIEAEGGQG